MTQPAPARAWTVTRLLLLAAFVCFLLAALVFAFGWDAGPPLAWGFGGFAAWVLAGALPE